MLLSIHCQTPRTSLFISSRRSRKIADMARGCTPDYVNAEWSFYRFEPSTAAAVFFCVVYVLTTSLHIFQLVRTKTWYMTAFVIGGLCKCFEEDIMSVPRLWPDHELTPFSAQVKWLDTLRERKTQHKNRDAGLSAHTSSRMSSSSSLRPSWQPPST